MEHPPHATVTYLCPVPDVVDGDDGPGEGFAELVERCRTGAPDAWREVVERLTPSVLTVARSLGLSQRDCEDVCQSTWVHVVRGLDAIEQPERLRPWVVTVARRESIKAMLAASRQIPVDDLAADEPLGEDLGPEDTLVARADDGRVHAALRHLPARHRALVSMLTAEPAPSYDEIADRLDIPRGSIGPTRGRILRRLRLLLEQDGAVPAETPADTASLSRARRSA